MLQFIRLRPGGDFWVKPFKTGKIRRRKRLKPSRKEEMHTKKQLLILIKSMMTESDTWTLVSETSSRVGELT